MYSKKVLNRYINERIHQKGWPARRLAEEIGVSPSNLTRAMESEAHNFTLPQFAMLVKSLELTPQQVMHVLTGSMALEGTAQLVESAAKTLVSDLIAPVTNAGHKRKQVSGSGH